MGRIAALMRLPEEERIFKNMSRQDITVMKWEKETCKIPFIYAMKNIQTSGKNAILNAIFARLRRTQNEII